MKYSLVITDFNLHKNHMHLFFPVISVLKLLACFTRLKSLVFQYYWSDYLIFRNCLVLARVLSIFSVPHLPLTYKVLLTMKSCFLRVSCSGRSFTFDLCYVSFHGSLHKNISVSQFFSNIISVFQY